MSYQAQQATAANESLLSEWGKDLHDDIVTRLLNSDGRVDELLKEAATYITTLRQSLVVLNNQLDKESQNDEATVFNRSGPLTDPPDSVWSSGDAA